MSSSNEKSEHSAGPLHLHKFAADAESDGQQADSGQTVFIRKTAEKVVEEVGKTAASDAVGEFGLPLREMLGLITYCYAKGVFCSRDIAALFRSDPALRAKFGAQLPEGDDIRRFRRRYSNEIEDVLEETFRAFPESTGAESGGTELFRKKAIDQVHEAAWSDNTRGRLG